MQVPFSWHVIFDMLAFTFFQNYEKKKKKKKKKKKIRYKKRKQISKKSTAPGSLRRSPIQVLTGLALFNFIDKTRALSFYPIRTDM